MAAFVHNHNSLFYDDSAGLRKKQLNVKKLLLL